LGVGRQAGAGSVDGVLAGLTLADGCDLVYALILERLERHVLNERHVAAVHVAAGAKGITLPTFDSERARLDAMLDDAPRRQYPAEQAALIAALGLGG
jgi:hypothetical protein